MIDDNWMVDYGNWEFNHKRFPDPLAMTRQLHAMGFSVMLWACPFVSPDSLAFRTLSRAGFLLRDVHGKPAIRAWWNGHSAILDATNPAAAAWFTAELDKLVTEFGIDGFKLDAGDPDYYRADDSCATTLQPVDHCHAFNRIGLRWPLNEYRAAWKCAGWPLAQRLKDKNHSWDHHGLGSLVPHGLAQAMMGYSFTCPDMIGGGEVYNFMENSTHLDPELFVRSAQCSTLFPMMQFSAAPWRVLGKHECALCREAAQLHVAQAPRILALAQAATQTGDPILRPLAWLGSEHATVSDQFLVGDDLLVAPVVVKGATQRRVALPVGRWQDQDGREHDGPAHITVKAPIGHLPWFTRSP
jgi:alpha-glucosidase (family GH31 glycosyl hydrolase)